MGIQLTAVFVDLIVTFEGAPLLVTRSSVQVAMKAVDPSADIDTLPQRAEASSTVTNSLARGVPVQFSTSSLKAN